MQAVSPRPSTVAHPSLTNNTAEMTSNRPTPMKRQSSASSHNSRHGPLSPPGSVGDYQPLRHHVKPAKKGPKVRLPLQNHGSGRNLVKLAQQAQNHAAEERRRTTRKGSKESDSEVRLHGSWDEGRIRRNLTTTHLPRNTSHTKLKKNLSHGQLTRLALNTTAVKGPPSPGLKGRSKRPKSADMAGIEKDLHEQEVELAQQQQEKKDVPKKVGFAVGSPVSDDEALPQMEGSGMQEDEWTDQSASASPYSTRQNTANNSRRASVVIEKPPDKRVLPSNTETKDHEKGPPLTQVVSEEGSTTAESSTGDEETENEEKVAIQPSAPQSKKETQAQSEKAPTESTHTPRSLLRAAKDHPNPATRRLLSRNSQGPAPALVSNVSALDDVRSGRGSPAPSMMSARSNLADGGDSGELVSRFMPSASHPSTSSVPNTNAMNTPKAGSLHTPENDSMLAAQQMNKSSTGAAFTISPVSPESARSLSSGFATPGTTITSRFRNEERMMNEKVIAEKEDAAAFNPIIPPHVFDRRNESLKSHLNLARLGGDGRGGLNAATGLTMSPALFQGRFKAVNTELKVVQRFRDPIAESVARLHQAKGRDFAKLRNPNAASKPAQKQAATTGAKVPVSRSAISLPRQASKLSTSDSPPNNNNLKSTSPGKSALTSAKSTSHIKRHSTSGRGKVTFSGAEPETREIEREEDPAGGMDADAVARSLWESIVA